MSIDPPPDERGEASGPPRPDVIDVEAVEIVQGEEATAAPNAKGTADILIDLAPRRPTVRLMLSSPLHWLSFGFGSGLSPIAPGTVGTLWAWVAFLILDQWFSASTWGWVLVASFFIGWWACTSTARALRTADPGSIVWDEVLAFWLVLWVVMPAGFWMQLAAFCLFRLFDAAKPGPVGWADRRFKPVPGELPGWRQGFGIIFDDLVAALCTLIVLALWKA